MGWVSAQQVAARSELVLIEVEMLFGNVRKPYVDMAKLAALQDDHGQRHVLAQMLRPGFRQALCPSTRFDNGFGSKAVVIAILENPLTPWGSS